MGATSNGVFLHLACGWVVFLTTEEPRGPLTVNIRGSIHSLRQLSNASPAMFRKEGISFPEAGVQAQTGQAAVWEAPRQSGQRLAADVRAARLEETMRLALRRKLGASACLAAVLGEARLETGEGYWQTHVHALRQALQAGQAAPIGQALEPLLGYGSGLTPSGDDVALGLLLALRRWGDVILPGLDLEELTRVFLPRAYAKTTTLAANLIECAADGQADERLIGALDGLVCGAPDAADCAAMLAEWGNSSGLDALAGMALVLMDTSNQAKPNPTV